MRQALIVLAALALAGCRHTPVTPETVFVDRVVETQVALDPRLTTGTAAPAIPLFRCRDADGRRSVCNEDMLDYLEALRAWGLNGQSALTKIRELQP